MKVGLKYPSLPLLHCALILAAANSRGMRLIGTRSRLHCKAAIVPQKESYWLIYQPPRSHDSFGRSPSF
jgi:hypothetical protein